MIRFGCMLIVLLLAVPICFCITVVGLAVDVTFGSNPQLETYFPNPDGYGSTSVGQEVVSQSVRIAASVTGQGGVGRISDEIGAFFGCLQETGSADVRVYLEQIDLSDVQIPPATGVVGLLDQGQFLDNFIGCAGTAIDATRNRRSSEPEPCYGFGTFNDGSRRLYYVFATSHRDIGTVFDTHFQGDFGAQGTILCTNTPQ